MIKTFKDEEKNKRYFYIMEIMKRTKQTAQDLTKYSTKELEEIYNNSFKRRG